MKSSLLTIRAIGAEFANRVWLPTLLIALALAAVLVGLWIWLTTYSAWWWLLGFPIVIILSVALGVLVITKLVIRYVRPSQDTTQKHAVKQFVDKLQRVSDVVQTPKFVLLFQIVRDIASPKADGFIGTISSDSSTLKKDFKELQKLFKEANPSTVIDV